MPILVLALLALIATPAFAQEPSARALFQSGRYQEAADAARAEEGSPDATYLAALSSLKLNQPDGARSAFARLQEGSSDDQPWHAIGASGVALAEGNTEGALELARKAAHLGPDTFAAQYQLGLALNALDRHDEAADAFDRAAQIDPEFAYAHYHAGVAFQKQKRLDKMASHFEAFLRLAPQAPEAPAVQSIMRTVRGK